MSRGRLFAHVIWLSCFSSLSHCFSPAPCRRALSLLLHMDHVSVLDCLDYEGLPPFCLHAALAASPLPVRMPSPSLLWGWVIPSVDAWRHKEPHHRKREREREPRSISSQNTLPFWSPSLAYRLSAAVFPCSNAKLSCSFSSRVVLVCGWQVSSNCEQRRLETQSRRRCWQLCLSRYGSVRLLPGPALAGILLFPSVSFCFAEGVGNVDTPRKKERKSTAASVSSLSAHCFYRMRVLSVHHLLTSDPRLASFPFSVFLFSCSSVVLV